MNVKIIFKHPEFDVVRKGMHIMPTYQLTGSYVDSTAYVNGVKTTMDRDGDGVLDYGKSIYATNVPGWGKLPGLRPMANTTTRFACFEQAALAAENAHNEAVKAAKDAIKDIEDAEEAAAKFAETYNAKFDELNTGYEFNIGDDYKEEVYWRQIGACVADQGFMVEVGAAESGSTEGTDENPQEGAAE